MAKADKTTESSTDGDASSFLKQLNAKMKSKAAFVTAADEIDADIVGYVSTGSTELDVRLGPGNVLGGIPLGRITEVFGPPSHGKSSLLYSTLAQAQRGVVKRIRWVRGADGMYTAEVTQPSCSLVRVMLIDTEGTYDKARGARMGLDARRLMYPDMEELSDLESLFRAIEETLKLQIELNEEIPPEQRVPFVIGFDTIAAQLTEAELDDKAGITQKPRVVAHWLKRLNPLLPRAQAAFIIINQITQKIGSPGGGYDSSGGHAFHHFSTFRLDVRRIGRMDPAITSESGIITKVVPVKAKATSPNFQVEIAVLDNWGVNDGISLFRVLTNPAMWADGKAPIETRGGWMKLAVRGEEKSFRAAAWPQMWAEDAALRQYVRQLVVSMIHTSRGVPPATVE